MPSSDQPMRMRSAIDLCALTLEIEPHLRGEFLRSKCGDDTALERYVHQLIRAHDEAGDFMQGTRSLPAGIGLELVKMEPEGPGDWIGAYQLKAEIGEGGFGTVWRAEQRIPVRRNVALKILKLGMDTRQVVARFEQERQALAVIDHPHVAKVYDAGATPMGRPYFVMELVEGERITTFCDVHRYSVHQRISLFVQVCRAIHHAHGQGIIHRDLKPSNSLVSLVDGAPQPKIIDFGVAKATQTRLTDLTFCTEAEQMVGTPAYMAPEQAGDSASCADARTDVYSLGVVLYELLTGHLPLDSSIWQNAGADKIRDLIRNSDAVAPSSRVRSLSDDAATHISASRGVTPNDLRNLLRGDLDSIVLKCLEREPDARYQTALELAEDLQRYQQEQPIRAGRPGFVYRLRKCYRRNRVRCRAIASACLIALIAAAFAASFWYQRVKADRRNAFEKVMTSGLMGHSSGMLAMIEKVKDRLTPEQVLMLEGGYGLLIGDYEQAIQRLENATRTRGDSVAARGLLAVAYFQNGQWEAYERAIRELRDMPVSEQSEDLLFKGFALGYIDPEAGLRLLDQVSEQQESPITHVIRGEIGVWKAMRTGDPADIRAAIAAVEKVRGMFGDENPAVLGVSLSAHLLAANLLPSEREAHMTAAIADSEKLESILEKTPDRPGAVGLRSLQLQALGRDEDAFQLLQRQHARASGGLVDLRYALELFRIGQTEKAIRVIRPTRSSPDAFFHLRMMAELPGGPARVSAAYPEFRKTYAGTMAELFAPVIPLLLGDKPRAIADARAFRESHKDLIAAWPAPLPVVAQFLAGEATAEQLVQSAGASPIALAEAHNIIAYWHLADGDREAAKAHFEAAVRAGAFLSNAHLDSRIHLARLAQNPAWPPWIPVRHLGKAGQ